MKKPVSKDALKRQLAKCEKALEQMDYQTDGPLAFQSGEFYGMRNALAWAMGENVASPASMINSYNKEQS